MYKEKTCKWTSCLYGEFVLRCEDGLIPDKWGYWEKQCLIHRFLFILFYSLNYWAFKEISLLFKIIPVMRNHSMHLEKSFHFIFFHSSPSVIINAWVQCMAIQVKFSFRIDVPVVQFIHLLTPWNVKSYLLRVECQFLFYLEQFTQHKSKRFDSCDHQGEDWLMIWGNRSKCSNIYQGVHSLYVSKTVHEVKMEAQISMVCVCVSKLHLILKFQVLRNTSLFLLTISNS